MKSILASLATVVLLLSSVSTFAMDGDEKLKHKAHYSKEQSEINLTDGSNTSIVCATSASVKGFHNAANVETGMIHLSFCNKCSVAIESGRS